MKAGRAIEPIDKPETLSGAAGLEAVRDDGHISEDAPALSLLDEIKMEAAQSGTVSSKSIELQTACGCGTCPSCLSITAWNAGSLIIPAIKVMARRRRNK